MARPRRQPSTELAIPTDPWERSKGESAKAYEAFCLYRDMGATRSLTGVARRLHEAYGPDATTAEARRFTTAESARATIADWSTRWSWVARAESFDIAEERRRRVEQEAERAEMEQAHLALSRALLTPVLARLRGTRGSEGAPAVPALVPSEIESFGEAARVAETAVRLERLTRGLPTDLTRGLDSFSFGEVSSMLSDVLDDALRRMPDEHQEPFLQFVRERTREMRTR